MLCKNKWRLNTYSVKSKPSKGNVEICKKKKKKKMKKQSIDQCSDSSRP